MTRQQLYLEECLNDAQNDADHWRDKYEQTRMELADALALAEDRRREIEALKSQQWERLLKGPLF